MIYSSFQIRIEKKGIELQVFNCFEDVNAQSQILGVDTSLQYFDTNPDN